MNRTILSMSLVLMTMLTLSGCYSTDDPAPGQSASAPSNTPVRPGVDPAPKAAVAAPKVKPVPTPRATPGKPKMPETVQQYFATVNSAADDMSTALTAINQSSDAAATDPTVTQTDDWKLKTGVALAGMNMVGEKFEHIKPVPRECRELQRKLRGIGETCVTITHQYAEGVDNLDVAELHQAARNMDSVTEQTKNALQDIEEIKSRYR